MKLDPALRRFFEEASSLRLTKSEKAAMRRGLEAHVALGVVHLSTAELTEGKDALMTYMRAHPVQQNAHGALFGHLHSFFFSRFPALALSAVIVVTGSSVVVASAAESALPGDALYTVKVSVLEPLRERMIKTPERRMAWKVRKVERRISEAKALQGRDRLTESHRTFIEQSIEREVAEIQDDTRWSDPEMVIASEQILEETMDAGAPEEVGDASKPQWHALKSFVRARRSEVHHSVRQRMETAYGSADTAAASATGLVPESAAILAPEPEAAILMAVPVLDDPEEPVEAPVMMMRAMEVFPEKESDVMQEGIQEKQMKQEESESAVLMQEEDDGREEAAEQTALPSALETAEEVVPEDHTEEERQAPEEGMDRLNQMREVIERELQELRTEGE